jgi:hypothetical protein
VQTLAETEGHFEQALVAIQLEHVAGSFDDGRAVLAPADVLFDGGTQSGIDLTVKIV